MTTARTFPDRLDPTWVSLRSREPVPWGPLGYVTYKRCVDVDTPVLCDDLVWRRAGDLVVGQGLVGFDEDYVTTGRGKWRYIRAGEVTHNATEDAETMGVELEDGTTLYATPDHGWLVQMAGNKCVWRETKDLAASQKGGPVYLMRPFGKVWATDDSRSGGYLAAAYDGEGNLDRLNGAVFVQVQNAMLGLVEQYLTARGVAYDKKMRQAVAGRQEVYGLRVSGVRSLFRLLGQLQPQRLLAKFRQYLTSGAKLPALRCRPDDLVRVVRVFPAGVRKVAVLSTSTKTHFTGGFASHNTYARLREDLGRTEEWGETVARCVDAVLRYGGRLTRAEAETLFEYVYTLRCTPPGRMLWQLGTPTVERVGGASLCNCYYATVDTPEAFTFAFEALMLGGGVGFSVLPSSVHKLPPVRGPVAVRRVNAPDVDFIVPDNREGWVELLRRVLRAYFETGRGFTYSTHCVRPKGARIRGFGGVASGPEDLVHGVARICAVLDARAGKHVRPVDALDVMNLIGSVVVSGNVRRSAQLAMGTADDAEFLSAKRWSAGVPNWRAMSNNSVARDRFGDLPDAFWAGYAGDGEAYGLLNLGLMRSHGRLRDGPGHRPDPGVAGVNPCGEQSLEDGEACDLFELFLPRLRSRAEFVTAARLGYKVCKTVLQLPFPWAKTEAVVRRNQRIGIGVSGYCQSRFAAADYDATYRELEALDRRYSRRIGAAPSVKLTTVKPSGTVSLLPGVTPGVHPAYSRYYVRRIRFSAGDPLVAACRDAGYAVEPQYGFDGEPDPATQVVSFPVDAGADTLTAAEVPAVAQLEAQKFLQTHWSDNNVSVTVYYRDEELPAVRAWLAENYQTGVKAFSALRHQEHGFRQAPYEEISAARYAELAAACRPLTGLTDARQWDLVDSLECSGGVCPVK